MLESEYEIILDCLCRFTPALFWQEDQVIFCSLEQEEIKPTPFEELVVCGIAVILGTALVWSIATFIDYLIRRF